MNVEEIPGLTGTERTVLGAIAASPRPLNRRDVMERLDLGDKTVRNVLTNLSNKALLTYSAEGQTKFYTYRDPGTMVTPLPAPPAADAPVLGEATPTPITTRMTLAQLQDAVIDAWCRGAGLGLAPKAARGPLYDVAASLGIAIEKGAYTLDDVLACTREKAADPYNRKCPHTWSLAVIARELYAWKQAKARRQKYISPPADFKAGLDPETGLHRVWDHQQGCVVEVELAPIPVPQRRAPAPLAPLRPALEGVRGERFQQDRGRETFSMQHYMVPSRTIITDDEGE
jgi:hypothetical protein